MKPYTYLLKHNPTSTYYYGVRYQNVKKKIPINEDLWTNYFTSSPKIKQLIAEGGLDTFDFEIRRVFDTPEQAVAWETKVLTRCKVLQSDIWINSNIAGHIMPTAESNKKISDFHKGKPKSEEHKRKIGEANRGKPKPPRGADYRAKMSESTSGEKNGMYGKTHSAETRKKQADANKGKVPHNKGVPMTEEVKAIISAKMKGRTRSPESSEKSAAKLRGQKRDKKYCQHCDRDIAVGWYNRHGPNCKSKLTT